MRKPAFRICDNNVSRIMRKPTFCLCENKDADQLRGSREADQRLCFRYTNSTIPLLSKSELSSLLPSSVAVQPGLCRTRSETRTLVFSCHGSCYINAPLHADLSLTLAETLKTVFSRDGLKHIHTKNCL